MLIGKKTVWEFECDKCGSTEMEEDEKIYTYTLPLGATDSKQYYFCEECGQAFEEEFKDRIVALNEEITDFIKDGAIKYRLTEKGYDYLRSLGNRGECLCV